MENGDPSAAVSPDYEELLQTLGRAALDVDASVIYAVEAPTYRLVYHNRAWQAFALANGGASVLERWPIGASILTSIDTPTREPFQRALQQVLDTDEPWRATYECPTPTLQRTFSLHAFRVDVSVVLVVNALLVERIHDVPSRPGIERPSDLARAYRAPNGVIVMCSACRRTRDPLDELRWDWVPAFVERVPAATSHGLCPPCEGRLYGSLS